MIKDRKPLSMIEATEYLKGKGSTIEIASFVKKFSKLNLKEAKELRKKIESLNLMKMNEEYISKIIDTLPENLEDLNKVFVGLSLDDEEAKKTLEVVKEFK